MDEYIVVCGKEIVWQGSDADEAHRVKEAIEKAIEGSYERKGHPVVYVRSGHRRDWQ